MRRQLACINDGLRPSAKWLHHGPVNGDAVHRRPVLRHRVTVAGFRVAAFDFGAGAIQKQRHYLKIWLGLQFSDLLNQRLSVKSTRPAIKTQRQRNIRPDFATRCGNFKQLARQLDRKIVDRFPAKIFQCFQRGGLAGPGHASNQQDFLGFGSCVLAHIVTLSLNAASAFASGINPASITDLSAHSTFIALLG